MQTQEKPWVGDPGRQHWPCAISICPQDKETHGGVLRQGCQHFPAHLELRIGLGKSLWAVCCVGPQNSDGRAQSVVCVPWPWALLTDLGD